jgi:hypothetical protein
VRSASAFTYSGYSGQCELLCIEQHDDDPAVTPAIRHHVSVPAILVASAGFLSVPNAERGLSNKNAGSQRTGNHMVKTHPLPPPHISGKDEDMGGNQNNYEREEELAIQECVLGTRLVIPPAFGIQQVIERSCTRTSVAAEPGEDKISHDYKESVLINETVEVRFPEKLIKNRSIWILFDKMRHNYADD